MKTRILGFAGATALALTFGTAALAAGGSSSFPPYPAQTGPGQNGGPVAPNTNNGVPPGAITSNQQQTQQDSHPTATVVHHHHHHHHTASTDTTTNTTTGTQSDNAASDTGSTSPH